MIISLTGFMGSGKSTVGKKLSALLSIPLIDLDNHIEEKTGRAIAEIFAADGEKAFRSMELKALSEIASTTGDIIISLGGGTIMTPQCARIIHEQTCCIYLQAATATLARNLAAGGYSSRPLLNGTSAAVNRTVQTGLTHLCQSAEDTESRMKEQIESLMRQRSAIYESTAHHIISIDGKTPEEIADYIYCLLHKSNYRR